MGTRYEDQPVEQWAGPESLDPTPVWKQYVLVAALLFAGLVVVVAVSLLALAPQLATPPALVAGDRLVLAAADLPADGASGRLVDYPWLGDGRAFYLVRAGGDVLALRATWAPRPGDPECRVAPLTVRERAEFGTRDCEAFRPAEQATFDLLGNPANAPATRGLDRYLVSMSGDRIIVNLSRVIMAAERTSGPVPTGIPTPRAP